MNSEGRSGTESRLQRRLFVAVTILGLATFAFSFGPVVDGGGGGGGWYVRFAALAGLSAGLCVLPRQIAYPVVTTALASMGFLDALSHLLLEAEPGWALTVIVVLNAMQTAIAVGALLLTPDGPAEEGAPAGYEAYVEYYNQAVRNYYGPQGPSSPQPSQHADHGRGSANAHASAPQTRHTERAAHHGDYADFVTPQGDLGHSDSAASSAATPSQTVPPGGLSSARPAQPPAGRQANEADHSPWPPAP